MFRQHIKLFDIGRAVERHHLDEADGQASDIGDQQEARRLGCPQSIGRSRLGIGDPGIGCLAKTLRRRLLNQAKGVDFIEAGRADLVWIIGDGL
jgi:hypothetical protein